MFDILTDEWVHPTRMNAPLMPLDISMLDAETAAARVAHCRALGIESLLLTSGDTTPREGVIDEIFEAAGRRRMTVVVHESLMMADVGISDDDIAALNPMLRAHTLRCSAPDEKLGDREEIISASEPGTAEEPRGTRIVMSECGFGFDVLSEEAVGCLICYVYEPFFERHPLCTGVMTGIYTDRISDFALRHIPWTYDLLNDYIAAGGKVSQLLSFVSGESSERSEGARLSALTAVSRFANVFAEPLRHFIESRALELFAPLPDKLISSCAGCAGVPVYKGELLSDDRDSELTAAQCLTDAARLCGNRTGAYICRGTEISDICREVQLGAVAGVGLYILPPGLADPKYVSDRGIDTSDLRPVLEFMKRLSLIGISCSARSGIALMCDDGVIPYASAARLRARGAGFTFVGRRTAEQRAAVNDGRLMIDRCAFDTLLIDRRIRLTPDDVRLFGEFAVGGGRMLRGGGFSEFASRQSGSVRADGETLTFDMSRCGMHHTYVFNPTESPLSVSFPTDRTCAAHMFDPCSGKVLPLAERDGSANLRLSANECVLVVWDPGTAPFPPSDIPSVSELISLHCGVNTVEYTPQTGDTCCIELYGVRSICRVTVGSCERVLLTPPFVADVTELLTHGECEITLYADSFASACLRITRPAGNSLESPIDVM